jgi:hypothetical protein
MQNQQTVRRENKRSAIERPILDPRKMPRMTDYEWKHGHLSVSDRQDTWVYVGFDDTTT